MEKNFFLCTNNLFKYIDPGMRYLVGSDWQDIFDVVMVNGRKPDFYTRYRAFRLYDVKEDQVSWQKVEALEKGQVYSQGSLENLLKLKGWKGTQVLYIGDSLFSDLVEPRRIMGWRTGAIIRELEGEMLIQNNSVYQKLNFEIEALEELLRRVQEEISNEAKKANESVETANSELLSSLIAKHEDLQFQLGVMVNTNFGSVFRVQSHPSQFAFSTQRYVDIYTSRLENLLQYPDTYTFYPQHQRLPHEPKPQYQAISNSFDTD